MDSNGSATPAPGCGVALAALAELRGISKDAARRLVKAGKVQAHRVTGAHGPEWCVHLDSPVEARHRGGTVAQPRRIPGATVAPGPDLAGLVELVDRLTVENRQLAEAAAIWQERARMLGDQLALAAPQSPPEAPGAAQSPEPSPAQPPPARWRVLAPWLLGLLAIVAAIGLIGWPR